MQFKASVWVLPVVSVLLGFSLFSYHLREVLVCYLIFTVLFACIMLLIFIGELGVYAGECVAVWVHSTTGITPVLAPASSKILRENCVASEWNEVNLHNRSSHKSSWSASPRKSLVGKTATMSALSPPRISTYLISSRFCA